MPQDVITPQMAREAEATCVFTNLSTLAEAATALFDRTMRPAGITVEQLGYLVCIHGLPDVTVEDLAARKAKDVTSVRAVLARMYFRGLLRLPDRDDQPLALTRDGCAKLDEGGALWSRAQAQIVEAVGGPETWDTMVRGLGDLFAAIRSSR